MMKRVLTTSVVAGLLGTLGVAPVVSAEGTLYGSVRSGIMIKDNDGADAMWDLGAIDAGDLGSGDRLWSRIGVRASHELDGGITAGLHIEKRLDGFRTRHQNVWLSGGFGKLTFGQQGSPYHSAVGWDGTNFTGGNFAMAPGGSRKSGISYASSLGGPFEFKALVVDDNSHKTPSKTEYHNEDHESEAGTGYGQGVDGLELSGSLSMGAVNITAGYADNDNETLMGATVGGSLRGLGWEVGFETKDPDDGSEDTDLAGFFVDYDLGDGAPYFYLEDQSGANDDRAWVVGYGHSLGSGVRVVGEHRDVESSGTTSILAVVVSF